MKHREAETGGSEFFEWKLMKTFNLLSNICRLTLQTDCFSSSDDLTVEYWLVHEVYDITA